jgi:hypothetical protein
MNNSLVNTLGLNELGGIIMLLTVIWQICEREEYYCSSSVKSNCHLRGIAKTPTVAEGSNLNDEQQYSMGLRVTSVFRSFWQGFLLLETVWPARKSNLLHLYKHSYTVIGFVSITESTSSQ